MMRMVAVCVLSVLGLAACARGEPLPATTAPQATAPLAAPLSTDRESPTRSVVRIASNIRKACGISDPNAHFEFDSDRIGAVDYPVLQKLVNCFTSGPLARHQMRLVGHADPRGSHEYNLVLGNRRADGVKRFLVEKGLAKEQAATTSRGDLDAKGRDEASWANDRRVDILLVD